jgi:potassium-transporting ATPase KdpC subunit
MWTALRFSLVMLVFSGVIYPLLMTALAQGMFPFQANGSLIANANGQMIGSALIGQPFKASWYFHPRPSANQYDAANSGGSNYGATNKKLIERVSQDATAYATLNNATSIPVDAVTASASGLDPDISLANARQQAQRVATERRIAVPMILNLIEAHTTQSVLSDGPTVRVLALNRALDERYPIHKHK